MLDIDDFKQVNDTYGHLQGDEVLRAVGRILDAESRGIDEPARYGGEEFVVGAAGDRPGGRASSWRSGFGRGSSRERVPRRRGRGDSCGDGERRGGVDARRRPTTRATLIAAADAALYEAKRTGKNRVVVRRRGPETPPTRRTARRPTAKGPAPARRK